MKIATAPAPMLVVYPSVFLAGGITNCPPWQDQVVKDLSSDTVPGLLMNPRRKDFPMGDPDAAREQIEWEFAALEAADIFSIWFCNAPSNQPICMYELGRHVARYQMVDFPRRLVIGVEPGYTREQDVRIQVGFAVPGLNIHDNLGSHVGAIATAAKELAEYYPG